MSDRREASARSPGAANGRTPPGPGSDRERVLLLECRLEEMQAALNTAREEADHVRTRLAEAAAKETHHARRFCLIHEELAEARAEIAILHRHLDRSEALRAELTGHLFEAGPTEDAEELMRLRRKALAEDQRASLSDRTIARLRERIDELLTSREILLTRIAEWQQLIREDRSEAADLSEFLAELRREILDLEHRSANSDVREARLRERLALAGIDPDQDEVDGAGEEAEATVPPRIVAVSDAEAGSVEPAPSESDAAGAGDDEADGPGRPSSDDEVVAAGAGLREDEPPHPDATLTEESAEPAEEADPVDEPVDAQGQAANVDTAEDVPPTDEPEPQVAATTPEPPSPTDALVAELLDVQLPELRAELLLRLGRTGDPGAAGSIGPWTKASEPLVRAAAYEALGRLLERRPVELEPHVRSGLADEDARVRRRVVLAAATARGLESHALLDPLREDPDPQVRRLIRQVLRQAPAVGRTAETPRSLRV